MIHSSYETRDRDIRRVPYKTSIELFAIKKVSYTGGKEYQEPNCYINWPEREISQAPKRVCNLFHSPRFRKKDRRDTAGSSISVL